MRLAIFVLIIGSVCAAFSGCSLAAWARLFNRGDHQISVLAHDGKKISIAPGESAPIPIWATAKDGKNGFLVFDGDRELFYAIRPDTKADREDARAISPILPSVSAKSTMHGIEYQFEYGATGEIFALAAAAENSPRANPQPPGFPTRPNQALEPTRTSVTSPAVAGAAPAARVAHL